MRIGNAQYISSFPFRMLSAIPEATYEENTPTQNAERLLRGELDVALVSVVDFAQNADWVALDFGVGCVGQSESILLLSDCEPQDVRTVWVADLGGTAPLLLDVIYRARWGKNLEIKTVAREDLFSKISSDGAVLLREGGPVPHLPDCAHVLDLGSAWHELTGLPCLFLIWAAREGALSNRQLVYLNKTLHKSLIAKEFAASHAAEELLLHPEACIDFVASARCYYVDESMREGFEEFVRRAHRHHLLPERLYVSARAPLLRGAEDAWQLPNDIMW